MPYFVLTTSEDGDVYLQVMDQETLLKELTPDENGYAEIRAGEVYAGAEKFQNLQEKSGTYIIKGELVVPRPKKVVSTFEVD